MQYTCANDCKCISTTLTEKQLPVKWVNQIINSELLIGGFNPSEKYEFVNWDDEIPNVWKMESHKSHVPNHQSVVAYLQGTWKVTQQFPGVQRNPRRSGTQNAVQRNGGFHRVNREGLIPWPLWIQQKHTKTERLPHFVAILKLLFVET